LLPAAGCWVYRANGLGADWGQQSLCFPAWLIAEIFCLTALLLAAGSGEKGGTASCRAGPYKAACVGRKVPCSLARNSMWGCVCVCRGGTLLPSSELVQINKRLKTACPHPSRNPAADVASDWRSLLGIPRIITDSRETHGSRRQLGEGPLCSLRSLEYLSAQC